MANERLKDKKDVQAQINEGLRDQNNLTSQYSNLLQTQLDSSKEITQDIKDRAEVLQTLIKNNDKSLGLDQRIANLKSKSAEIEEKIKNSRDKSGRFAKGYNAQTVKNLKTDKASLDTQLKKLNTQKKFNEGLGQVDGMFGGIGGKIKGFMLNPLTAGIALLMAFSAQQETIAKEFGGIGVTTFRDDLAGANQNFTKLGLSSEEAQASVSQIANNFGLSVDKASALSETVARISASTGISTEETSKLVGLFTQTQGLTGQQAENLLLGARQLAVANGVAPNKVLSDIAADTETFARFSKDGGQNLLRAAVQARSLGISLATVAKSADSLLDFQGSLNKEIEASILLGRGVNLQKARELSLNNDIEGLQQEILRIVGSEAEFNKMNRIQRDALASAIGMEVSDLQKLVVKQKEQKTLQGEINRLVGENEIPEETMTGIAQILANFQTIGLQLAEQIGPSLNMVLTTVNMMLNALQATVGVGPGLIGIFAAMKAHSMITAMKAKTIAASTILASFAANPIKASIGLGLGLAGVAAGISALSQAEKPASAQMGGITTQEGLVNVHPQEAIVPIERLGGMIADAMKPVVDENKKMRAQNETLISETRRQAGRFADAVERFG
jgi:hypothetical protein